MNYSTSRSPSPSSPATIHHRSLVHELQTGYNAAEQLRRRLIRSPEADDPAPGISLSDVDLAELIFNSFNSSLSIARNCDDSSALISPRFSSDAACKIKDSGCGDGRGAESSRIKDRRGCYKRRKRGQSWTTEGETPNEDGHAWRKYGQKMILHSKFPRNYYRCTHKTDQNCQALKQVQKISEEPPRYKTSYNGEHTCQNPHKMPQIIIPSSSPDGSDSSILLSFERASDPHRISPFFPPSIKEEYLPTNPATASTDQTMVMNMMMMINSHQLPATSSDYNYLSSPGSARAGGPHLAGSDHGADVISVGNYSCSPSPTSLENIDHFMMLGAQDHLDDLIEF